MNVATRERGFTLVEVLVALTVLSLLLTALYAGLRGATRSAGAAAERGSRSEALRVGAGFLRRYLESAQPLMRWRDGTWTLLFEGEEHSLRFTASMPPHLGGGGLYEITVALEEHDGVEALALTRRLLHPDLDEADAADLPAGIADRAVLVEAVEEARFEYFGAEREQGRPAWAERWDDPKRMPLLVRLRLTPAGAPPWPDLVARPRIDLVRALARSPLPGSVPGAGGPAPATGGAVPGAGGAVPGAPGSAPPGYPPAGTPPGGPAAAPGTRATVGAG